MIYKFIPPFRDSRGKLVDGVDMPDDAENEYAEEIKRRKEDDQKPKRARQKKETLNN